MRSATMIQGSSDRAFGLVMTIFFGLIALIPLYSEQPLRWWALLIAQAFLSATLLSPHSLARLNSYWLRLGLWLSAIVSPIALGIVFFGVITPIAWLLKLLGKSLMPLTFDAQAESYWIIRQPPGPDPKTMQQPF